jgi:hypothetical protein
VGLLIKHTPPEYIDRMLNGPKALRYRLPHLLDRAKQDLQWGDTLAYQRTMVQVAQVEQEIARQDAMLEKMLREEKKKR